MSWKVTLMREIFIFYTYQIFKYFCEKYVPINKNS